MVGRCDFSKSLCPYSGLRTLDLGLLAWDCGHRLDNKTQAPPVPLSLKSPLFSQSQTNMAEVQIDQLLIWHNFRCDYFVILYCVILLRMMWSDLETVPWACIIWASCLYWPLSHARDNLCVLWCVLYAESEIMYIYIYPAKIFRKIVSNLIYLKEVK